MSELSSLKSQTFYKPFTTTAAGFVIPLVTGSLSTLSSGLILYVIFNSPQKLSTTYHRIMAFMSMFDIISSIFISLGTVMMPSDNIYKFVGPNLGNHITCQIQGWLVVFGLSGSTSTYACLAWYFVMKITFKMESSIIKKWIEPFMFLYTSLFALFTPCFYLSKDLLNPSPYDNFCTIVPYPDSCDRTKWYDWNYCEWGEGVLDSYFKNVPVATAVVAVQWFLILIGMSIILWTVRRKNIQIEALISQQNVDYIEDLSQEESATEDKRSSAEKRSEDLKNLKYSRQLIFQALMFIAAFFVTWFFNLLSVGFNIANFELDTFNSILFPLQGLWNALIFFYDKAHLIQDMDQSVRFWQAIKMTLSSPSETPLLIVSNITAVNVDLREQDVVEINPELSSQNSSDEKLSQVDSAYDDLSALRQDFSAAPSQFPSKSTVSSAVVVEHHDCIDLLNTRKTIHQVQKETQP